MVAVGSGEFMTGVSGEYQSTMRLAADSPASSSPSLSSQASVSHVLAAGRPDPAAHADAGGRVEVLDAPHRAGLAAGGRFAIGPYRQLETRLEHKDGILWYHLRPEGVPSFTRGLLRDIADMQRAIMRVFDDCDPDSKAPFRHLVLASRLPGIFNMGGDLGFFADRIRSRDRAALADYARACIEVVYTNAIALDLPIVTIALVQGDALGGGFEAALSCNVIVAEKSAKLGLPETLFNLFPGMGAYSLLARKLDPRRAERMVLSGRIYSAGELHEMGVVDVLAEDGQGEEAVRQYIAQNARHHGVHRALAAVRRRLSPLTFAELEDVIEIWVETAFQLPEPDLRKMERLKNAQVRRLQGRANGAAHPAAR